MGELPDVQSVLNDLAGRTGEWTPKYPDFATSPERGRYEEPQTGGTAYEFAPPTSHVYGWKFQSGGFVKKFYGPSVSAPAGTIAVLGVAFKPSPPAGDSIHPNVIKSEYEYYFASVEIAENYLGKLRSTDHPGQVVKELIATRVPYKRVS